MRLDKGKRKEREDGWHSSLSRGVNLCKLKAKEEEKVGIEEENGELIANKGKRRKLGVYELASLGVDSTALSNLDRLQFREARRGNDVNSSSSRNRNSSVKDTNHNLNYGKMRKRKPKGDTEDEFRYSGTFRTKRWIWLSFFGTDLNKFVGLQCKVFWPLDADWYKGSIIAYDFETGRHTVEYEDGDEEKLILSNERIKFYISPEEMQCLKLRASSEGHTIDVSEMVVLAASLDGCEELDLADIMWAKLTGHAMWPALVLDDSLVGDRKGLNRNSGEKSVLVQFFSTHDFARSMHLKE